MAKQIYEARQDTKQRAGRREEAAVIEVIGDPDTARERYEKVSDDLGGLIGKIDLALCEDALPPAPDAEDDPVDSPEIY